MAAWNQRKLSGTVALGSGELRLANDQRERVVFAVELVEPTGQGEMRARLLEPGEQLDLTTFFEQVAGQGATLYRWGIDRADNPPRKRDPVPELCGKVQRWLKLTYSGAVGPKLLQGYLDEFSFHFNQGSEAPVGLVFRRLLRQAMKPIVKKK